MQYIGFISILAYCSGITVVIIVQLFPRALFQVSRFPGEKQKKSSCLHYCTIVLKCSEQPIFY